MAKRTSSNDGRHRRPRSGERADPSDPAVRNDRHGHDADREDRADVELDLIPGDPPVPITTWRTPAAEAGMSTMQL
jgi:hypothetical protein